MGSSFSGHLAELVLMGFEKDLFNTFPFRIPFFVRYVDDCLAVVKREEAKDVFGCFNSRCSEIQFTLEEETKEGIPFLDVWVRRESDGRLETSVYRKAYAAHAHVPFDSCQPLDHKRSAAVTLFLRAWNISSRAALRRAEEEVIVGDLVRLGYPIKFIECCRSKARRLANGGEVQGRRDDGAIDNRKGYITLPYIPTVTERVRKLLQPYVRVACRPLHRLKDLVCNIKDKTPPLKEAGVIYKTDCPGCGAAYVGQTGRSLDCRLKEHASDIRNARSSGSPWVKHIMDTGHSPPDLSQSQVLDKETVWRKRVVKEAWYIKHGKELINRNDGWVPPLIGLVQSRYTARRAANT